jgi:hypothetical protein
MDNAEEFASVRSLHECFSEVEAIKILNFGRKEGEDPESWKIALNLIHILNSSDEIKMLLQTILANNLDERSNFLDEIGVEIRHIQWHIQNMEYFGKDDFSDATTERS